MPAAAYDPWVQHRRRGPSPGSKGGHNQWSDAFDFVQLSGCLDLTQLAQVAGEVMGRALNVDVVVTEHLSPAGEGVCVELPGLLERLTRYTRWVNYLGLPAISLPCGLAANGLPVGFQLLGRPYSEPRLLAAGRQYQAGTAWHQSCPALQ